MSKAFSKAGFALMFLSMYYASQPDMPLLFFSCSLVGLVFFITFGNE